MGMIDKIIAGSIVTVIFFLLAWRVWRVMNGKSSGCGCGKQACPLMREDDGPEAMLEHREDCRSGMIVADFSPREKEK